MDDKNTIQRMMSGLINDVRDIVESGLRKAYQNVNAITVFTYWQVGKRIVEEEQRGEKRAEYGRRLIETLAQVLSMDYTRGFTARDLRNYRQLYLCFNDLEIWYTRVPNLTWTQGLRTIKRHIAKLTHIKYVGRGYSGHWEIIENNAET